MRILTTAAQVHRVAGIDGGNGDYPNYPYGDPIPQEVGRALLSGLSDVAWPADRDLLNDDGGFIVIYDAPDEFELRYFGFPRVNALEGIDRIECRNGETWWWCMALTNNETSIDYAFNECIAPQEVLASLMEQFELLGEI